MLTWDTLSIFVYFHICVPIVYLEIFIFQRYTLFHPCRGEWSSMVHAVGSSIDSSLSVSDSDFSLCLSPRAPPIFYIFLLTAGTYTST